MKVKKLGALVAVAAIAISACGTSGSSGAAATSGTGATAAASGGTSGGAQPDVCKGKTGSSTSEIHVYSSLPLEGTSLEQTQVMVDEIKAVLDGQKIGNYTIKYTSLDDASPAKNGDWDGTVEQSNANKAANDPDAMVYIGTYNSGAAKLSIPILNGACLVMFSPANSYPGLTKAVDGVTSPGEPDSYYPNGYRNYARDINTDDAQGGASSEWAFSLGSKKAYVIDDGQTYGSGIGKAWAKHFAKIGGTVVSPNGTSESYDPKATDFAALGQKILASGADTLFIGAITGNATAKLWKDIKAADPNIKIFAPDGVNEKSWFDGTGTAGVGTYLTFGGVDISQLTGTGKDWATAFQTKNGKQPPFYAAYAHAAAEVVLAGLKASTAVNDRWADLQAIMASKDIDTVIGKFTLNAQGDPQGGVISSYIMGQAWPPEYKGVITQSQPN